MSESRFEVGMKVICISLDGYHDELHPIGRIMTIERIGNHGQEKEYLTFVETLGMGGSYSRKFETYEEPFRMPSAEFDLDEILQAEELVKG